MAIGNGISPPFFSRLVHNVRGVTIAHAQGTRNLRFVGPPKSHTAMLDLEFAQFSDPGKVRKKNEDFLGHVAPASLAQVRTQGWLFVLADGVSGHERGEVAARIAVETVVAGFRGVPGRGVHTTLLPRLVHAANMRVHEAGLKSKQRGAAMATTLVVCAVRFDRAVVSHVGDSRCYLIRRGRATSLTRDHTVASEQVRKGELTEREAAEMPTRHVLSRSLGNDMYVGVDTSDHQVHSGDVLLLCSDGLHVAVPNKEIARIVSHAADLSVAAQDLVALANQRDGSDNISMQLVRIRGVERMSVARGRPLKYH
jgi:PPM family protein phosphatase